MDPKEQIKIRSSQIKVALGLFVLLVGGAFIAARFPGVDGFLSHSSKPKNHAVEKLSEQPYKIQEFEFIEQKASDENTAPERLHYIHYTTTFTIWATFLLLIPALCLFPFHALGGPIRSASSYWTLFWTLSFLAYVIHVGWAVVVPFQGRFCGEHNTALFNSKSVIEEDGKVVAPKTICNFYAEPDHLAFEDSVNGRVEQPELNTILLFLWGVSVWLTWARPPHSNVGWGLQWLAHSAAAGISFGSGRAPKASAPAEVMGWIVLAIFLICILLAFVLRRKGLRR